MELIGSSAIVETAIGVVFIWFLAAGLVTAAVELVATLLGFRAKLLWRTVDDWFSTSPSDDGARRALGKAWSLTQAPAEPASAPEASARSDFVDGLPGVSDTPEVRKRTRSISRESAVASLTALSEEPGDGFEQTQLGIALGNLPRRIRNDATARREWLGRWFDGEMERLAVAYRSRVRWWAGLFALLVTLGLGLDSIHIVSDLYREPTRRQVVVAAAEARVVAAAADGAGATTDPEVAPDADADADVTAEPDAEAEAGASGTTGEALGDVCTPAEPAPTPTTVEGEATPTAATAQQLACARALAAEVEGLDVSRWWGGPRLPRDAEGILLLVAGLAASVAALTAGAPWWFSVLQRLMGLRGKPPTS